MDKEYLDKIRYDWTRDPRHLKIEDENKIMIIPDGRCFCCARIFLNAQIGISYCKECDKAMSMNPLGVDHDYDSFGPRIKVKDKDTGQIKTINLLSQREIRSPIRFSAEHLYFDKNNKTKDEPHFVTAAGKIIDVDEAPEDDAVDRLYDIR